MRKDRRSDKDTKYGWRERNRRGIDKERNTEERKQWMEKKKQGGDTEK